MMTQPGNVAVVTGAAGGLGREIAEAFVRAEYRVVLTDIDGAAAIAAAASIDPTNKRAIGVEHDIRSAESFQRVLSEAEQAFAAPRVLVNNAGRTLFGNPLEITPEEFNDGLELNLTGTFIGCQTFGKYFSERGVGRIINIASLAGQNGGTASGIHYASAKGGVLSLTKVFARELGPAGVTVNAIAPGPLDLPVVRNSVSPERLAQIIEGIPVRTLLSPRFVAETAVLLASDHALSVTGACWDINGGLNLR